MINRQFNNEMTLSPRVLVQKGITKVAGSVLREAMSMKFEKTGRGSGTWRMFLNKDVPGMGLKGERVGFIKVKGLPGEKAKVSLSNIGDKWRGKGLGKKMYGEAIRRHPVLTSDKTLSPHSFRTWESMLRRTSDAGLKVRKVLPMTPMHAAPGAPMKNYIVGFEQIFAARPSAKAKIGNFKVGKLPRASFSKRLLNRISNSIQHSAAYLSGQNTSKHLHNLPRRHPGRFAAGVVGVVGAAGYGLSRLLKDKDEEIDKAASLGMVPGISVLFEKRARVKVSPLNVKGKTSGMYRRASNLQKGIGRGKKTVSETSDQSILEMKRDRDPGRRSKRSPLDNGIVKTTSIPTGLKIGVGGVAAGVLGHKFGWPWFQQKYMGVRPETMEKYRVVR